VAGSTSSYYDDPFKDDEPLSAAQQEALNNKLGVERDRITTIMDDDTGKYQAAFNSTGALSNLGNVLSGSTPAAAPATPVSTPAPPPDYYIKDIKVGNSYSIPSSKNLFGGNLDVSQNLEDIVFEQYGDGSLRNAIAYIVPWQRAESNTQSALQNGSPSSPSLNFLTGLINDFSPSLGFSTEGTYNYAIDSSSIPVWNIEDSLWEGSSFDDAFNTDLDFFQGDDRKGSFDSNYFSNAFKTENNGEVTLSQSEAEKRQTSLSSEIPMGWKQGILAGGRFLADQLIQNPRTGSFVDTAILQASKLLKVPSGPVYVGNANGLINQILDYANIFGFNVPRGLTTSVAPDLQSKRSKSESYEASGQTPDGMWQFLFNPSELTLTATPDFKNTETWGVSDEPNIGQPLHFTSYKNPELKFSKVLLNGYVFGRKVESLQQGLFKLFLENPTNDAKHGPRVLEFVWGKRSFGPCVMKDVSITEKMWDDGELVNAEVSFTLVKVPEWTINDGQVSTFDPTAIPLIAPPTKTTPSEAKSGNEEEKTQPPERENKPAVLCWELRNAQQNAVKILDKTFEVAAENKTPKLGRLTSIVVFQNRIKFISDNTKNVIASYNEFLNSVTKADPSVYITKCAREVFGQQYGELISISNNDIYEAYTDTIEKSDEIFSGIRACSNELRKALKTKFDAGKCGAIGGGNAGGAQSIDPNAPAYIPPGT
jgi:hypothetical protein